MTNNTTVNEALANVPTVAYATAVGVVGGRLYGYQIEFTTSQLDQAFQQFRDLVPVVRGTPFHRTSLTASRCILDAMFGEYGDAAPLEADRLEEAYRGLLKKI